MVQHSNLNHFRERRLRALHETTYAVSLFMLGLVTTAFRTKGFTLMPAMSTFENHFIDTGIALTLSSAAQVAMLLLRNGGSAVDAVEMAIKILEDREITNAGYGSNLAMDGVVECDASIVDHHGRSGAVGAVARKSSSRNYLGGTNRTSQRSKIPFLWLDWSSIIQCRR